MDGLYDSAIVILNLHIISNPNYLHAKLGDSISWTRCPNCISVSVSIGILPLDRNQFNITYNKLQFNNEIVCQLIMLAHQAQSYSWNWIIAPGIIERKK